MKINEILDTYQDYFKLSDGQIIRVDYRQGLNADAVPGTIKVSTVDPKILPSSGLTAIQPWDRARQNIKMAIQKWVQSGQKAVAEQYLDEKCWDGYKQVGMKKKGAKQVPNCVPVKETRRNKSDLLKPTDADLDHLHHKFVPAWSMLDHNLLSTKYDFSDDDTALEFVNELDQVEQSLDHNAVITLDNARVMIEVRTQDVDGLTKMDFEFAIRAQSLAEKFNAEQAPHATNKLEENLRDWFKEKWVRFNPQGKIMGPCARGSSKEGKPKCLPQAKAHALGKKGRASAAARKRREDPNPERKGKAINVKTKK